MGEWHAYVSAQAVEQNAASRAALLAQAQAERERLAQSLVCGGLALVAIVRSTPSLIRCMSCCGDDCVMRGGNECG
jgi:hypothetical protein